MSKRFFMNELNCEGLIIPYLIKKSARAKHLRITIAKNGVVVTMPAFLNEKKAISFVEQKKGWIAEKVDKMGGFSSERNTRQFTDGEELPFQGEIFKLRVVEGDGKRTTAKLKGDCFWVQVNREMSADVRPTEIRKKLEQLYKDLAREALIERVEFYKLQLGVDYNQIRFKEQKSRWGSCSKKCNLNFNWKLVMAPPDVIDYVVAHELCHLRHMNHSRDFWRCVEALIPNYRESRLWLKKNGWQLDL